MNENVNSVYLPEENIVVSFAVTADKPFNKCFECKSFRNGCSGPNLSVMSIARVCEFLQSVRVFLNNSYQDITDGTGISLATVKRTLTGKIGDPSFFTISSISSYLLGDPNGKYPCAIPNVTSDLANEARLNEALKELERVISDNLDHRKALDNIHTSYNAEMELIRAEAQRKIDFLLDQNAKLRADNDNLWAENNRKSKMIDLFIEKQLTGRTMES